MALLSAKLAADYEVYSFLACFSGAFQVGEAALQASIEHAKENRYCSRGDCIVALHRIGNASVIKIVDVK